MARGCDGSSSLAGPPMKRKPSGRKYRNLTARGPVIYFERVVGGRRIRFSCDTDDWQAAAATGISTRSERDREAPVLRRRRSRSSRTSPGATWPRTLRTWLPRRADRRALVSRDRSLASSARGSSTRSRPRAARVVDRGGARPRAHDGDRAVLPSDARWSPRVRPGPRHSRRRVRSPPFREQLRRRSRTKGARAASDASRNIRPIESPTSSRASSRPPSRRRAKTSPASGGATGQGGRASARLEERAGGLRALVAVLAMLDAGLRIGEVAGLTWGQVRWGADEDDPTRAL